MIERDGERFLTVMVLPHITVYWSHVGDAREGRSFIHGPHTARKFAADLPDECDRVTECDCSAHEGVTMHMLDLEDL